MARTAVVAGTASAVAGRVHHRQNEKWSAEEEAQYAQQQQQQPQVVYAEAPPAAGSSSDDQLVEIQKLAQLHSQGILTDEEFSAKKAQILGI
ncbi:MAG: SHOCT domain-containing protein [Acidimicrobiales bacterium]